MSDILATSGKGLSDVLTLIALLDSYNSCKGQELDNWLSKYKVETAYLILGG